MHFHFIYIRILLSGRVHALDSMASSRYNTSHAISSTKGVFFMTYDEAFALLRKYNSEPFHITHALTCLLYTSDAADEL